MRLIILLMLLTMACVTVIELKDKKGNAYQQSWNSEPQMLRQETRNGPLYYLK